MAFRTFPPPLVRRLGNDPVHHGALAGGIRKDAPRHVAKGCLGQTAFDGVIQLQDGRHGRAQNAAPPEELSNATWFHSAELAVRSGHAPRRRLLEFLYHPIPPFGIAGFLTEHLQIVGI